MASQMFPLVSPSFPPQEPWQQHDFGTLASASQLPARHSRGLCSGLAYLTRGGLGKRAGKWRKPCPRRGLGQGAVSVQKGEGRRAALSAEGTRMACSCCCCSTGSSKNREPTRIPISRDVQKCLLLQLLGDTGCYHCFVFVFLVGHGFLHCFYYSSLITC